MSSESFYLHLLKDRINLVDIPFTERGSRLLVFRNHHSLHVRLAERWIKQVGQLSAYRQRPPIVDQWQFTDENGQPLVFELDSYPQRVDCKTAIGTFSLAFVDTETLLLVFPPARCGIKFLANLDQAISDRRGGVLRLTGDIRRNIAFTTNAPILRNIIQAQDNAQVVTLTVDASQGAALLLNITPRLGFNRYMPDPVQVIDDAARRWHEWFDAAPPVLPEYQTQYYFAWWVMRSGLISTRYYLTREAMTPSKSYYVGVWQWDAYFHALAYRHIDKRLAQDQLRILLDHQREDGMIPDAVHDEGIVTHLTFPVDADVTKPPLVAWAAWKLYEQDGDVEFLNEIYQPLVLWHRWWFEKNDLDGNGLCEYQHPFSSGLDDSPLWDEGMPVEAPDLNSYLCLQQQALANIARVIGEHEEAIEWDEGARLLAERMLRSMWDEEAGLFWARKHGQCIRTRTPFNLFPLLTGLMPSPVNARLVAHLTNPLEFWPRYPVPSVALDDPKFDPNQMWRGPTWSNINYLLIDGLETSGYWAIGRELRRKTLELIMGQKDIYEYYHPVTGEKPPKAASLFGWSSAVFIDLAIRATQEKK